MSFDCNLSSIQKNPHLVSNNGFLPALKLHHKHIEQLRCRGFSKLLLLFGRKQMNIELILPTWIHAYDKQKLVLSLLL